ncbi:MAG: hypothetical protein DWQ08_10860 [Proteobacteria bacterium]|nr:MAG: hypothetical protein DWQ08_10860 [Pseudomonadota bacterium]
MSKTFGNHFRAQIPSNDSNCDVYWELSDYLPLDTAIEYWCDGNPVCLEAKRQALLSAIERGHVKYRRADGKDFKDPVHDLYSRGLILVHRESFESWAVSVSGVAEKRTLQNHLPMHPRSETTYLNIIGALVDVMLAQSPGGQRLSAFDTQADVINALLAHHEGKPGLSRRTLEDKFAAARRELIGR